MPVFSKDDKNVLFIHIPKTGGSSVTNFFRSRSWDVSYEDRSSLTKPGGANYLRRISPQHLHGELINEIFDLGRFDVVFSIIRNPLSRFKSEFAYQNSHLSESELTNLLVENWTLEQFDKCKKNNSWSDNHFRPQVDFLTSKSMLFRQEDGLRQVAELEAALSNVESKNTRSNVATLPISNASKLQSDRVPISPKLRRKLLRIYKKDFTELNYSPDLV